MSKPEPIQMLSNINIWWIKSLYAIMHFNRIAYISGFSSTKVPSPSHLWLLVIYIRKTFVKYMIGQDRNVGANISNIMFVQNL